MASVGTVTFDIAAESAKLRSELDKVKKELGGVSQSVRAVNDTLKSAGKLVAGAFSIGAIAGFIGRVNSAADSLNDLAGKLNASAANLSTIQLAAQQSGGSVEGVTTAFGAMTNKIGEAVSGNKQAIAAFDKLGLSATKLAGMRTDEAFQAIAEATSKVSNQYERATAAQDIFGKGARDIQGLLNEGTAAIDGARAALEAHGAALSDLDIARIGVMNDELGAQETIITNLATKLLASFSPAVSVAVDSLGELLKSTGGTSEAGRIMGITFVVAVKSIQTAANLIMAAFEAVRSVVSAVLAVIVAGVKSLIGGFAWVADKLGLDVANKLYSARDAMQGIEESLVGISRASQDNAVAAASAAGKAALDILNSANLFDEASARMEAKAAQAASTVGGAVAGATGGGKDKKQKDRYVNSDGKELAVAATDIASESDIAAAAKLTQEQLNQITTEGMDLRLSMWDKERLGILSILEQGSSDFMTVQEITNQGFVASLGMVLQQTGAHNKKIAKIQQGIALAQAVWSTARGVANALGSVPFPGNLAAAAVVAAQGMLQIAAIKKQKYSESGGGGSYSAGGGGGGNVSASESKLPDTMAANEQQQARGQAQIVINGNIFSSRETAQYLIDEISKAVTERDVVLIGKNSRQAQELMG
ncbi:MAG: hypothetical protein RIR91_217 [Verrucomicrobiota bacterium]|jgi:hypothetical protein